MKQTATPPGDRNNPPRFQGLATGLRICMIKKKKHKASGPDGTVFKYIAVYIQLATESCH